MSNISLTLPFLAVTLSSLMYIGFGVALFFFPSILSNAGISLVNPTGVMEARSFYGGLEIGLGCFLMLSYFTYGPRCPLQLSLFLLGFTLLGRFYGLYVDQAWTKYFIYAVLIEGSLFILCLLSFYKVSKS